MPAGSIVSREVGPDRLTDYLGPARHFFAHRFYCLPKCGPDGYKLALRMCGPCDVEELWEVVLYAHPDER
ncbi:MAG TPA: hypothetical protein VGO93_13515, partial [Candidatus Xenobia bacterium]